VTERQSKILKIVTDQGEVTVAVLAEEFGVSHVTIRKDLDGLERRGLIRREHGSAHVAAPDSMTSRLAYHYDVKQRIARHAAGLVAAGEMVLIESGSCCALLAEELVRSMPVTIVTNSAFIAEYVRRAPHADVILLGGEYQLESQVTVGPITRQCASNFYVDKLFVGLDGYESGTGFQASNFMRATTVRDLAERARQVVVLTESSKFGRRGAVHLLPLDRVSEVVTDSDLEPAVADELRSAGLTVSLVSSH
jgi:DeoR/GlpR family transcriptional regulator of sugar metabolism